MLIVFVFFFFQAEDGIRDVAVTGVQTCALPICLVVRAKDSAGKLVAFAYDIPARKKYPDIDLSALDGANGFCGISPSGRYVLCLQTLFDGTETAFVFGLDGTVVQHWTDHHRPAHGDMTIDADGRDVYVGISKAYPDKYRSEERRVGE